MINNNSQELAIGLWFLSFVAGALAFGVFLFMYLGWSKVTTVYGSVFIMMFVFIYFLGVHRPLMRIVRERRSLKREGG